MINTDKRCYALHYKSPKQQLGAVLVVSLVLLLVMTVLGASNMRSSSLELKMAVNTMARQQAFLAAETALEIAENNLATAGYSVALVSDCASGSAICYDDLCTGGRCFFGSFPSGTDKASCLVYNSSTLGLPAWINPALDVWEDNTRHQSAVLNAAIEATADYIVEFQCFLKALVLITPCIELLR